MNMLEALDTIRRNCEVYDPYEHNYSTGLYWARPVSWRGLILAFTWETGRAGYNSPRWVKVPSFSGGSSAFLPTHEVFEEWEVVSPNTVNAGE